MGEFRRVPAGFDFFDQEAIEKKLERMAAEGWMPVRAGRVFWTYRKCAPQKLRFAVTYFPGASELDPEPGERQLEKEELCAADGWRLVLRYDAMQVFCTNRAGAPPLETDPVPRVENIRLTLSRRLLASRLLMLALILWSLYLQLSQCLRDPVGYLSDVSRLYSIPSWTLLLLLSAFELASYFRWIGRARSAAERGVFLPPRSHRWLPWVILALVVLLSTLSRSGDSLGERLIFVCVLAVMGLAVLLERLLLGALRRRGVRRWINLAVSCGSAAVLVTAGMIAIIAAGIGGLFPAGEGKSEPVDSYEWKGETMYIYDEPLPLEVEDLADADLLWSREARLQESPLLAYGEYSQDIPLTGERSNYELRYSICDVKFAPLRGFIRERLIASRQDVVQDGEVVFVEHFEPVDPEPFGADEAWRLLWDDGYMDTWLLFWDGRMVEIKFYWQPTAAQIKTAAEILRP